MPKVEKDNIKTEAMYPQGIFICSVCGKEFKADGNTRYIISGGYTCGLKCFLNETKRREAMKKIRNKHIKKGYTINDILYKRMC